MHFLLDQQIWNYPKSYEFIFKRILFYAQNDSYLEIHSLHPEEISFSNRLRYLLKKGLDQEEALSVMRANGIPVDKLMTQFGKKGISLNAEFLGSDRILEDTLGAEDEGWEEEIGDWTLADILGTKNKDKAMMSSDHAPGGIDLNDLDLRTSGQALKMNLDSRWSLPSNGSIEGGNDVNADPAMIAPLRGLTPVIINVIPSTTYTFLGLNADGVPAQDAVEDHRQPLGRRES